MLKARQLELSLTYAEKTLQDYAATPPDIPKLEGEESSTIQKLLAAAEKETSAEVAGAEGREGGTVPDYKAVLEQCTSARKEANK